MTSQWFGAALRARECDAPVPRGVPLEANAIIVQMPKASEQWIVYSFFSSPLRDKCRNLNEFEKIKEFFILF